MKEIVIEVVATITGWSLIITMLAFSLWLCAVTVNLFVGLFV